MISTELRAVVEALPLYDGLTLEPGHTIACAERFKAGLLRDFAGGIGQKRAAFTRLAKTIKQEGQLVLLQLCFWQ